MDRGRGVRHRIEHGHQIRAVLLRPVDLAIRIHGRLAPVGRDQVVEIGFLIAPIPQRQDEIALDALRSRRLLLGRLAGGNAVGPVRPFCNRTIGTDAGRGADHLTHGLPRLDTPGPGVARIGEVPEPRWDGSCARRAERMAGQAAMRFNRGDPVVLVRHTWIDAVALRTSTGEFALRRDLEHRIPVNRRIIFGRRLFVRCQHGAQIEVAARLGVDLVGVDEAIATHPDFVFCLRQVGDEVTPLIVGDDDLGVFGRQIGGLRDHPDAGFRPLRPCHDAADVVAVDRHGLRLRTRLRRYAGHHSGQHNGRGTQHQSLSDVHGPLPRLDLDAVDEHCCLTSHARPCAGHPRLSFFFCSKQAVRRWPGQARPSGG